MDIWMGLDISRLSSKQMLKIHDCSHRACLCCCLIGCISKQGTARSSASKREQTRPYVNKQYINHGSQNSPLVFIHALFTNLQTTTHPRSLHSSTCSLLADPNIHNTHNLFPHPHACLPPARLASPHTFTAAPQPLLSAHSLPTNR